MSFPRSGASPRRRARASAVALALGMALLGAACVPGTDGSGAGSGGAGDATAVPDPSKEGKVTLTVWDQEVRGGQNAEIEKLNKEFQDKYPNVRIKRVARSFTDLKTTLKLALSGNNPPDVVQANQGYADMVAFAKAGMLTPLDNYAGIYGWNSRYPNTLLDLNRVSVDGMNFGTGRLYGLSQTGEYIGLYYNKDVLEKAGVEPPRTWAEFTAALPKLKQEGELPVQFGNLDKYPAIHTFGVLQDQAADGPGQIRNTVLGKGDGFDNEPTRQAARTLADWAENGYLPKGANGTGYDDAAKKFAGGDGAFLLTGTWQLADLKKQMGGKLGFMPPPPGKAGEPLRTTGGQGLAWSVTSKSRHPDVAAAYLEHITNAHAAEVMMDEGVLPAVPGKAAGRAPEGSPDRQMVEGWEQLNEDDGMVPYLDYTTPTIFDTLTADLQGLLEGSLSPDKLVSKMQEEYETFREKQSGEKADR
ncbi:extracellular solute-binding protein [Streptomyces armeniacus]|uniref:Extracellular solute-binding protein n=1 Tax=Streptomyces armeniacus TaxID=83291 RepID=A0A345XVG1_9ACTN|nr:extracellular solute-binding protein [Streptomyces armeniacus]AXK35627.1 extracellular solute-binding protein [Streptomyces armeniacus]